MKRLIWVGLGLLILSVILVYFKFGQYTEESGDARVANAFATNFVYQYINSTYNDDVSQAQLNLKKFQFKKKHYMLDIDAQWFGKGCDNFQPTICLVKKNFVVRVRNDGKIYSTAVNDLNGCAIEHKICRTAPIDFFKVWVLSQTVQKELSNIGSHDPDKN